MEEEEVKNNIKELLGDDCMTKKEILETLEAMLNMDTLYMKYELGLFIEKLKKEIR